jgi:hypothetical protein
LHFGRTYLVPDGTPSFGPLAQKSFWTHLMELLGDMDHVESRFGPLGDSVSAGARYEHGLHQTYHRLKIILDTPDGTPRRRGSSRSSFWSI